MSDRKKEDLRELRGMFLKNEIDNKFSREEASLTLIKSSCHLVTFDKKFFLCTYHKNNVKKFALKCTVINK